MYWAVPQRAQGHSALALDTPTPLGKSSMHQLEKISMLLSLVSVGNRHYPTVDKKQMNSNTPRGILLAKSKQDC